MKQKTYIKYSVGFFCIMGFLVCLLLHSHRSFVWVIDGLEQQFPFFMAEGEWLRQLINQGHFVMWSNTLGYGSDTIVYMANTLGNPINLISYFATEDTGSYLLNATVPITLYLAGLSFLSVSQYTFENHDGIWLGALIYVFSGYSIIAFSQIYMLYPLVLAPLVLKGIESTFNGRYALYSMSIMLFALYGLSQTYIAILFVIVYCIIHLVFTRKLDVKNFSKYLAIFSVLTLLGIGMAGALVFPVLNNLLQMNRLSISRSTDLLYSLNYYKDVFFGMLGGISVGADTYLGLGGAGFISFIIVLFTKQRDYMGRMLKTLIIISLVILLCPMLGRVTNGFAYPNNRWTWVISLLMGYSFIYIYQNRKQLSNIGFAVLTAYISICLVMFFTSRVTALTLVNLVTILLLFICLFTTSAFTKNSCKEYVCYAAVLFSAVPMLFLSPANRTVPGFRGSYAYAITDNPISVAKTLTTSDQDGIDFSRFFVIRNSNALLDRRVPTFYNSFYNNLIDEYHTSLGLNGSEMNFSYNTLNSRQVLESLAGVRYFVTSSDNSSLVPSLFSSISEFRFQDGIYQILENNEYLPTAFISNQTLSRDTYDNLTPIERQQVLSRYLVVNNSANSTVENLGIKNEPYSIESTDNASSDGDHIITNSVGASVKIRIDAPESQELYVQLMHLHFKNLAGIESETKVYLDYGSNHIQIWMIDPKGHLYGNKDNWLANVGHTEDGPTEITLTFDQPGEYSFESLNIYTLDESVLKENLSSFSYSSITDQQWGLNSFAVTYYSDGSMLALRIPYSSGWKAYIDGTEVQVEHVDVAFMGLTAEAGVHEVRLIYTTPFLREGTIVSLICMALYSGLNISNSMHRRGKCIISRTAKHLAISEP